MRHESYCRACELANNLITALNSRPFSDFDGQLLYVPHKCNAPGCVLTEFCVRGVNLAGNRLTAVEDACLGQFHGQIL